MMAFTSTWLWALVTTAFTLLYIARSIYRLTFHPLASYPGPKIRAISHIPHAQSMWRGRLPVDIHQIHESYGEVVRIAPNMLSFIAPNAWKDIYSHGTTRKFQKYGYTRSHPTADHLLSANDADHARQRKLINHAFSDKALKAQEGLITTYIEQLLEKLQEQAANSQSINLKEWLEWTTFDIIGDLSFGSSFGCLESGNYAPWVAMLFSFIKALTIFQVAKLFPPFTPLFLVFAPKKDIKKRFEVVRLSNEKVQQRLAAGEQPERSDFWTYILRHNDERGMTTAEMESNGSIFITGGSETVATALCGIIYLLAKNPKAMEQLRNEVRSVEKEQDLTMTCVSGMKYLHATINEGLRLYPPVPGGLQRTAPQGGDMVAGHLVPEGTIVSVPQLPAYLSAKNFTYPKIFAPERWLGNKEAEGFARDQHEAFQPFGMGPRNCVGKNLAVIETKLILARLVWRFDWDLVDDKFRLEKQKMFLFREKPDLNLKLRQR